MVQVGESECSINQHYLDILLLIKICTSLPLMRRHLQEKIVLLVAYSLSPTEHWFHLESKLPGRKCITGKKKLLSNILRPNRYVQKLNVRATCFRKFFRIRKWKWADGRELNYQTWIFHVSKTCISFLWARFSDQVLEWECINHLVFLKAIVFSSDLWMILRMLTPSFRI